MIIGTDETMTTTTVTTENNQFSFSVGSHLFYVVVGAGGIMSLLLFTILILCVSIGCLASRKRRSHTLPPLQPPERQNRDLERHIPDQEQQSQTQATASEPTVDNSQLQNSRIQEYDTVTDNERDADQEHYAVVDESQIGQTPRPSPVPMNQRPEGTEQRSQHLGSQREIVVSRTTTNPSSVTLRKSRSHDNYLNQDDDSDSQKRRPSSWSSPNEPVEAELVQRSSKLVECEVSRIYDSIVPPTAKEKEAAIGGREYNKLVYQGYPKKQQPLPQPANVPLGALYSRLNTDHHRKPLHTEIPLLSATEHSDPDNKLQPREQNLDADKSKNRPRGTDEMNYQMTKLLPSHEADTSSPLYSNVNDELNRPSQPTQVYSVPDMKKKREGRQAQLAREDPTWNDASCSSPLYSNLEDERSMLMESMPVYSVPEKDKKNLPQRHQTVSASPVYANFSDKREPIENTTGPVYSIPDMQKKRKGRQMKREQCLKKVDEQRYLEYPMRELPPRHKTMFSSPLYSNTNAEMHPVPITHNQNFNPVYSTPDSKMKMDGISHVTTDQGNNRAVQPSSQQITTSPSPPPLPSPLKTTESSQHEQTTTFGVGETMYPHVSVPSCLRGVKPIPTSKASSLSQPAHVIYDHPKRKDIYKPLPLEGLYDVPSSIPKPALADDVECNHYDMPSSLSLIVSSKGRREADMQRTFPSEEGKRLTFRSKK